MVQFVKNDLEFILDQILISEQHAALSQGMTLTDSQAVLRSLLPNSLSFFGLRTVDGSLNNLVPGQELFGASDGAGAGPDTAVEFPRLLDPNFLNDMDGDTFGGVTNTNYALSASVADADPRIISNLIVDQTEGNFAANAAFMDNAASSVVVSPGPDGIFGNMDDVSVLEIPNTSPDVGLSAPFNGWMTFFGQFFDHGLDLVNKGGSGTIFIPLQPDDPLFVSGSPTNFMVVTRASVDAGPDNMLGTADDVENAVNADTPFVDQNQTYSSHPSIQVFLRAYVLDGAGVPVPTGRLLENRDLVDGIFGNGNDITAAGPDGIFGNADDAQGAGVGGMATWGVLKAQARDVLGIVLDDLDVLAAPLLATDQYGNFIPGANGLPQLVLSLGADGIRGTADDVLLEGNLTTPVDASMAVRASNAFLVDIAHNAVPVNGAGMLLTADVDTDAGNPVLTDGMGNNTEYDDELLDEHFIAGDGRVNENVALTAIHHVFHSEHNRLVEQTKAVLLAADPEQDGNIGRSPLELLNSYLLVPVAVIPTLQVDIDALVWNGERLFQAAKFGTEMQYQHLVFEEFARKVQPLINVFGDYDAAIDPSIVMEFSQAVYRFGHSMLTETIDRYTPEFAVVDDGTLLDGEQLGLIRAFLNPLEFDNQDGQTPDQAAGSIVRGMTRVVGNQIDEFVTEALRNNLVGLPLDLAAINIARGRDVGIPSLNEVRAEFFRGTGDNKLAPYTSWVDFAQNAKHEESVVNFIAAYGTHPLILAETTAAGKRAAAWALVTGLTVGVDGTPGTMDDMTDLNPDLADRLDFLNSTGLWASDGAMAKDRDGVLTTGLGSVDLWIGGLAEQIEFFNGMLGSTFAFVFENQLEALQDGDRFYYLARTAGLNFLTQLEQNSFAELIRLNTDATHLPGDVFSVPDLFLEVDPTKQFNAGLGMADPVGDSIFFTLVNRNDPNTPGLDTNYLEFGAGDGRHLTVGGTEMADTIILAEGDDAIYGDGGDDYLNSGTGADVIFGGTGDDIIITEGGPGPSNLQGQDGNDVISAGPGEALVLGGAGKDFILAGPDLKETFAGTGDDFIHGGSDANGVIGGAGDDWIEGGAGADVLQGDSGDEFQSSRIIGNDVLMGDEGADDLHGESGDDILVESSNIDRFEGGLGFDWVTHSDNTAGVDADMLFRVLFEVPLPPSPQTILDRFGFVEGLTGSAFSDILRGDDSDALALGDLINGGDNTLRNFDLIDGLRGADNSFNLFDTAVTLWGEGNIILGGNGSDLIEGRGGNDIIDGDLWLNVRISIRDVANTMELATVGGMFEVVQTAPANPTWVGRSLNELMLDRSINPGQLHIVREILTDTTDNNPLSPGYDGDFDTALFTDLRANYTIETNGGVIGDGDADGFITVTHNAPLLAISDDGTDLLRNIERLQFSDQAIVLSPGINQEPIGLLTITGTPNVGQVLTVTGENIVDLDNTLTGGAITGPFVFNWQVEEILGGGNFIDLLDAQGVLGELVPVTGPTFTVTNDIGGRALRVRGTYQDQNGVIETVFSAGTGELTVSIDDVTVSEMPGGSLATFTVSLSTASAAPVSVDFATADGTAIAGAPGLGDYDAISGTLNFAAGVTSQSIIVQINDDALGEDSEAFFVNLSAPVGAAILDGQGIGTINDDDQPTLSVDDVIVNEAAGTVTFTVSLSAISALQASVDFATADGTAMAVAPGSGDYDATSGTLIFAPGDLSQQVVVQINNDVLIEGNENFVLDLTNPIGASILDGQGLGTITDDDAPPATLSIDDVVVNESMPAMMMTTLIDADFSAGAGDLGGFAYSDGVFGGINPTVYADGTRDPAGNGNAGALNVLLGGLDNNNISNMSGGWEQIFNLTNMSAVTIAFDYMLDHAANFEANETADALMSLDGGTPTVLASLTGDGNGGVDMSTGWQSFSTTLNLNAGNHTLALGAFLNQKTFNNEDSNVFFDNVLVTTQSAAPSGSEATFTVSLSAASAAQVSVDFATADGTAIAGAPGMGDFDAISGSLIFAPGETSKMVTVQINDDALVEGNEDFVVDLTNPMGAAILDGQGMGTIVDDEGAPTISIDDVTVNETVAGTVATFTVSLSAMSAAQVSVDFTTADGTAIAGAPLSGDYDATNGTLIFTPGQISQQIMVQINDDTVVEGPEDYFVNLTNPIGAAILDGQGLGTIIDDDLVTHIAADFSGGAADLGGFAYTDGVFGGSNPTIYADGTRVAAGNGNAGALNILLGGLDNNNISNMSGAWEQTFNLADTSALTVTFDYMLDHAADFEAGETVDALVSLDGGVPTVLDSLTGDGNGGVVMSTGWQSFTTTVNLNPGNHTLSLGALLNQKTFNNEDSNVFFDNVSVTSVILGVLPASAYAQVPSAFALQSLPEPATATEPVPESGQVSLIDADFVGGAGDQGGFIYSDGAFGGAAPAYADGTRAEAGNGNAGALGVTLGDLDNNDINDMSGGWERAFNLANATAVTIAFDFMLDHAADFEANETVEALMSIDGGTSSVLASLTGDGNGGPVMTTGWQSFEVTLDLSAGDHTLALGAFLNQKTFNNEVSNVFFDNVSVIAQSGDVPTAGNDLLNGTAGDDVINGLAGNDTIFGLGGNDSFVAGLSDGDDSYDGGAGLDTYDLSATGAGATVDLAAGTASSAETGNDQLVGVENVIGGFGNDTILASNAVNVLAGGAGEDSFVFRTLEQAGNSPATRDQITDFEPGDLIDLSGIDANSLVAGNQAFNLVFDTPAFTAAGEIKFRHEQQADGDHTILEGDVDGDLQADFQIDILGLHDLNASDFAQFA